MLVAEDSIRLVGFATAAERDWFRLLTSVQGVGARVALAILSALSVDELHRAVASGDHAMIARAQGVGPKLAVRIVNELKDKAGGIALGRGGARRCPKAASARTPSPPSPISASAPPTRRRRSAKAEAEVGPEAGFDLLGPRRAQEGGEMTIGRSGCSR